MKQTFYQPVKLSILVLLLLLSLSTALLAQHKAKGKAPKIGFCLDDFNSERWYQDRDYFINKVEELGGEVLVEVAYSETAAQIKQIRKLADLGVKVLVIVPTDANALSQVIEEVKKKGVKVISYDRMIMNADIDYYVSYDNEMVGELMARYMVEKKPKGNYAILNGPDNDPNVGMIKAGQMRVLQPFIDKGDIKLVFDDKVDEWTEMEGMLLLDGFLGQYKEGLDVVMACNDGLASGAILALEEHRRKGMVLVSGQDADIAACKLIYKGDQTMTIYKPVRKLAFEAAELAMELAYKRKVQGHLKPINNGKKEVTSLLFAPVSVDKQNLASTVLKDQNISEKELSVK